MRNDRRDDEHCDENDDGYLHPAVKVLEPPLLEVPPRSRCCRWRRGFIQNGLHDQEVAIGAAPRQPAFEAIREPVQDALGVKGMCAAKVRDPLAGLHCLQADHAASP
jgi:hypothetical protein